MQPPGQAVAQPVTNSTVEGSQPQGTMKSFSTAHVGTGQRMGSQPSGLVVWVTRGQGIVLELVVMVLLVRGGSTVMLVMTPDEVDVGVTVAVEDDRGVGSVVTDVVQLGVVVGNGHMTSAVCTRARLARPKMAEMSFIVEVCVCSPLFPPPREVG